MVGNSATTTEISVHAFSGIFNPRTIRVMGWVQGKPLSVLIDSGSTHKVIQESVANRLGYEIQELHSRYSSEAMNFLFARRFVVKLRFQYRMPSIVEDLFVLAMGGANIILEIQ